MANAGGSGWEIGGIYVEPGLRAEKHQADCSLDCRSRETQTESSLEVCSTIGLSEA